MEGAKPSSPSEEGEIPLAAFLFAKLFLCAYGFKEKADYRLSICNNLLIDCFVSNLFFRISKKYLQKALTNSERRGIIR